jgi:hypothetical protein
MQDLSERSRRDFLALALGAAAAPALTFPLEAQGLDSPKALASEFLMDMVLDTAPAQDLGARRIVPVTGGTFEGPKLKGTALSGGGDWIIRRPDGANELNVRATLKTDDDQLIYVSYRGLIYTPPGGNASARYWRTTPVFETASPKYDWLTRIIAVGVGLTVPGKAAYRVYTIL